MSIQNNLELIANDLQPFYNLPSDEQGFMYCSFIFRSGNGCGSRFAIIQNTPEKDSIHY